VFESISDAYPILSSFFTNVDDGNSLGCRDFKMLQCVVLF